MLRTLSLGLAGFTLLLQLLSSPLQAQPRSSALSILQDYERQRGARTTVLLRDLQTGEELVAHRAEEIFRPASLVKIATTGAFLALRGSDYRFHLPIAIQGKVQGETLHGDIILGASADPSIGSHYIADQGRLLREVSERLTSRGIRRITGQLLLDMAGYPPPFYSEHWPDEDLAHYYAVPISGFSIADNYADLYLYNQGNSPEAEVLVAGQPLPYLSELYSGSGSRVTLTLPPTLDSLFLSGSVRDRSSGAHSRYPLSDPPSFAALWLTEGLRQAGFELARSPQVRYAASALQGLDTLGFYTSLPADTLARITNFRSANGYAEALAYALNSPSDRPSGRPLAMRSFWQDRLHLTPTEFHPQDGSGLSPTGGLSARALSRILSELWHDQRLQQSFLSTLPEAGVEGTVRSLSIPEEIQAYLKSGSMRGVRGYAGYIRQGEKWYSIVYIANGSILSTEARSAFTRLLQGLFTDKPLSQLLLPSKRASQPSAKKASSSVKHRKSTVAKKRKR